MDETRRFLRYITPGGIFVVEVVGLLFLLFPKWVGGIAADMTGDSGIGLAIAGLVTAGTVGFVLGTIHHWKFNAADQLDYSGVIRELIDRKILRINNLAGSAVASRDIDRAMAFAIVTSLWHQLTRVSKRLEGVEARAQRLADFTHSLGTARVASVTAGLTTSVVALFNGTPSSAPGDVVRFLLALGIGIGLVLILSKNYYSTSATCQAVVEESLTDALVEQNVTTKDVFTTHIMPRRGAVPTPEVSTAVPGNQLPNSGLQQTRPSLRSGSRS